MSKVASDFNHSEFQKMSEGEQGIFLAENGLKIDHTNYGGYIISTDDTNDTIYNHIGDFPN